MVGEGKENHENSHWLFQHVFPHLGKRTIACLRKGEEAERHRKMGEDMEDVKDTGNIWRGECVYLASKKRNLEGEEIIA